MKVSDDLLPRNRKTGKGKEQEAAAQQKNASPSQPQYVNIVCFQLKPVRLSRNLLLLL